ncbi:MAG: PTS lactose/cellobiose transporter subunit IIA [Bacillus sp. (in: Bacteria)]|nr:PTS lactose/cellobiose transporter subunit IIA [Bacillus sp. (in: firmicutes)]
MDDLELACFNIISFVGSAKSSYIEAIQYAKKGDFEQAETLMEKGVEMFQKGHKSHAELIQKEASGNKTTMTLLLVHAEDQLMAAESFRTIAQEFIDVYKNNRI